MKIKFRKTLSNAVAPKKAHSVDYGFDLTAAAVGFDEQSNWEYHTGIIVDIPEGYIGLIVPKQNIANTSFSLINSVGVIHPSSDEEIQIRFRSSGYCQPYQRGDVVAQLLIIPAPIVHFEEYVLQEEDIIKKEEE